MGKAKNYNIEMEGVIDIVVSMGGRGGVENVVNRTALFLQDHGWKVRILQLADTDYTWYDKRLEWHSFWPHGREIEFDPIIESVKEFYVAQGTPDLVLATTWPLINTVAAIIRGELHADYRIGSWMHASLEKYDSYLLGGVRELANADFHLAINRELHQEIWKALPMARIYPVDNPVDMQKIKYSDKRDIKQFAVVCRQDKLKNTMKVLSAMERMGQDTKLHVVGTGEEYGKLVSYVEEKNLTGRVHFYGWKEEPWELLKDVGVLVSASEEETGPLVAVEALLCGMPVIASRVGAIPEWIIDGVNGWSFDNRDFDAMERYMKALAGGTLPCPPANACRDSASRFQDDRPLEGLLEIIEKEAG